MNISDGRLDRAAKLLICLFLGGALLYLSIRYALPVLLPFLLAFPTASGVWGAAEKIGRGKKRGTVRAVSMILYFLLLGGVGTAAAFLFVRTAREAGEWAAALPQKIADFSATAEGITDQIASLWGSVFRRSAAAQGEAWREAEKKIFDAAGSLLLSFAGKLSGAALTVAAKLPAFLLSLFAYFFSSFLLLWDYPRLSQKIRTALDGIWGEKGAAALALLKRAAVGYGRSYAALFLITLAELILGLTLLGVEAALPVSLLIALLDILPLFGVGTALIPWAAALFFSGETTRAVGFLVLFAVMTALRQVIEPKLVGKNLGLHPFFSFAGAVIGLRLMGVFGLFVGPAVALFLCRALIKNGRKEPTGAGK